MAMHVDSIERLRAQVISRAKSLTGKKKFIILSDGPVLGYPMGTEVIYLAFGRFDQLTKEMALSLGNVAGIILLPALYGEEMHLSHVRRIRQLASADGAMMICDEVEANGSNGAYWAKIVPDIHLKAGHTV